MITPQGGDRGRDRGQQPLPYWHLAFDTASAELGRDIGESSRCAIGGANRFRPRIAPVLDTDSLCQPFILPSRSLRLPVKKSTIKKCCSHEGNRKGYVEHEIDFNPVCAVLASHATNKEAHAIKPAAFDKSDSGI